jgi:phenylacetate-coenzyme A ligase PaaK-like adenylate-forming protein
VTAPAPTWLDTAAVAERAQRHQVTVRRAASSAELHSHQQQRRGHRRFNVAAVDVWIRGGNEKQQIAECGCARVLAKGRRLAG